jgi:hypothetical protein
MIKGIFHILNSYLFPWITYHYAFSTFNIGLTYICILNRFNSIFLYFLPSPCSTFALFYLCPFLPSVNFSVQSFSTFGHVLRSVILCSVFLRSVFSTFSHSTFSHSTFSHSTFSHSTFGLSTFGHSTFGHSTFTVSIAEMYDLTGSHCVHKLKSYWFKKI